MGTKDKGKERKFDLVVRLLILIFIKLKYKYIS